MTQLELANLYVELESFLRKSRGSGSPTMNEGTPPDPVTTYWGDHPRITNDEMRMLQSLSRGPLGVERIAACLGRSEADAVRFLEAMIALGLVQREGERYAITATTLAYLQLFLQW